MKKINRRPWEKVNHVYYTLHDLQQKWNNGLTIVAFKLTETWPCPPNEDCRRRVSLESRYGTWDAFPSLSFPITFIANIQSSYEQKISLFIFSPETLKWFIKIVTIFLVKLNRVTIKQYSNIKFLSARSESASASSCTNIVTKYSLSYGRNGVHEGFA